MDAGSQQKHLKISNLTITNVKLMKLTMIMNLHRRFNVTEDWGARKRKSNTSQNELFFGLISSVF